jgi:Nucleoside 2-deoxyribosyltransferase.
MMIYVASSWRNEYYPEVVKRLREEGFEVYDFRIHRLATQASNGILSARTGRIGHLKQYRDKLSHPLAERQFKNDIEAIRSCDACVLVIPCGRSAHTEAGWFAGAGKPVVAYIPEKVEPELMYKLFAGVCCSLDEVVNILKQI